MANEPILGSTTICASDTDGNPVRLVAVDGNGNIVSGDIRLLVEIGDRSLRDLGIVTVDGTVTLGSGPTGASAIEVQGTVAHDGVDGQNPLLGGARAIAHGANPPAVAAADRTVLYANRHGIPFVLNGHPNILSIRVSSAIVQTDVAIITVSAGTKIAVTRVSVGTAFDITAAVAIRVGFGTASTPTGAGVVYSHPGLGAAAYPDTGAIFIVGGDGEDLRYTQSAPGGSGADVVVYYFLIES